MTECVLERGEESLCNGMVRLVESMRRSQVELDGVSSNLFGPPAKCEESVVHNPTDVRQCLRQAESHALELSEGIGQIARLLGDYPERG